MKIIESLLNELEQEAQITRKMLKIVPDDQFDFKAHPKSMDIKNLTTHIADLPTWFEMAVQTDELDFEANPYKPEDINNTAQLLDYHERCLDRAKQALQEMKEENLNKPWTLRSGDTVYMTQSKYEVIRHTFAQTIHHRAQLGVNLRLLNIPIPGSYGPSADEMGM